VALTILLDGFVNRLQDFQFPSFLLFKLRGFDFYPGGTFTHCSCQPSLDAHLRGSNLAISLAVAPPAPWLRTNGANVTHQSSRWYSQIMTARISIEPGKRSGQPCVRGLRITVWDVLSWLAAGMTEQEILDDYPELEPDDFPAVYDFAAHMGRRVAL
jgi:uncharacterized protein (DUF433 family)